MSYPLSVTFYATPGIGDLRAQLFDSAGTNSGAAISTGFVERGTNGMYVWFGTIDDSFVGGVEFYSLASASNILAIRDINPREVENADAKTSTRATPAQVATELGTYDAPTKAELDTAVSGLPTSIWAHGTRTLTSFGTLVADIATAVWAAAVRTLTMTAAQVVAAAEGDPLPIYKSVTFNQTFTGLTIPADWVKIWFTLKRSRSALDSAADIQIVITNGGDAGDGITVLNEAASTVTTKPYGALVINQAAGTAALTIQDDGTALLTSIYSARKLGVYDLKVKDGTGATVILTEGTATLDWAITRQI